ncbi:hypothetical protein [Allobaculum sp. Allo2]|uniref:hypothetical protein n=1 Tax=Allobaculum sp. Allo2 TaxID=2853432 RepID=UPI001F60379E|nr:hypothetical protein [Allobaculum sp. Allo2]UNT92530.1 hypothetical protein KWG61_10245 [Allobaculum sp. Allo2]
MESGFKGDIEYVSISSQKLTKEQAKALSMESSANLRRDMFSNSTENTWLFVGGADTEGDFDQIGDIRPYSNQFEEFVRWDRRSDNGFATMRYVTNGAAAGNDLKKRSKNSTDSCRSFIRAPLCISHPKKIWMPMRPLRTKPRGLPAIKPT